jgi:hypothetical protein
MQKKNIFFGAGEIVEYILNCSKMYYGLSTEQCKWLAYEMVVVNHIPHPSNWDELKMAGFGVLSQGTIH